jgi:transcriptional regulator
MYNLPYFKEEDKQKVLEFIREHPFAFICGCDVDSKPVVTQIPCFIEEKEGKLYLSGHIMKNTDHHKAFQQNPNVLAVFTGAHTYVSASWYSDPQTASTWNYLSVHAKGKMRFLDEAALLEILKHTTNHFENNPHSPANFENLPVEYVQKLTNAIVAFEVEVESMDNVFKLSQNRDKQSYENIIGKLNEQDHDAKRIATEMQLRKDELFSK